MIPLGPTLRGLTGQISVKNIKEVISSVAARNLRGIFVQSREN
jgi:hypothetical protein